MTRDEGVVTAATGPMHGVTQPDVEVRRPLSNELTACRLVMPEAFTHGVPELLVAVSRQPRRVLGVLAFRDRSTPGNLAWHTQLHVVGPYRRRGIGRQLIDTLRTLAEDAGIMRLTAVDDDGETGAAAFLHAAGFRTVLRAETFEFDVAERRSSVAALYERLAARGRIPATARVVSLTEAAREPLVALLAAPPDGAPDATPVETTPQWSDTWCRPEVLRISPVVLLDTLPVAVLVAERRGTCAMVRWRVVAPAHRLGWANILLGHAGFEWMGREGVTTCRFTSTSLTPDTGRMARVHAIGVVGCTVHYTLDLQPKGRAA